MAEDLEILPYELENIKKDLKTRAVEEFGLSDAEFEGSNVSQLINLISYAALMQNTNTTFAFNEMFISKAKDRRNVIKHAKQMGYIYKKRISYQYKIKLKVLRTGTVILNKYTKFKSNGNDYIYMGENILDDYGTYAYLKLLSNENNNNLVGGYGSPNLGKNKFIVTEDQEVAEVLYKENIENPRILINVSSGKELPKYSTKSQDIYIEERDEEGKVIRQQGYRNFIKVGTVDTFVTDNRNNLFKIQMTLDDNIQFPVPLSQTINSKIIPITSKENTISYKMEQDTEYLIDTIKEIRILLGNDKAEINIDDINNANSINQINILDRNINITVNDIEIKDTYRGNLIKPIENSERAKIEKIRHIPKKDSYSFLYVTYNGLTRKLSSDKAPLKEDGSIEIPQIVFENGIITKLAIKDDKIVMPQKYNKICSIFAVTIVDKDENKSTISSEYYTFKDDTVTIDTTSLNKPEYNNGEYTAELILDYFVPLTQSIIKLQYVYSMDTLSNIKVEIDYNYIVDNKGYLVRNLFFSDYRGEKRVNELEYSKENPEGWDGFYSNGFDSETNILTFPIGKIKGTLEENPETLGSHYHNCYVDIEGKRTPLNKIMTTPFKRTRFSFTEPIIDPVTLQISGFKGYDERTTFASVTNTEVKNELELIVKQGTLKRSIEETDESLESRKEALANNLPLPIPIYKYPELQIQVRPEMAEEGFFSIHQSDIEDNGIELYITRLLPDGTKEIDYKWTKRNELLTENIGNDDHTFITMADDNYEDYLNIYTKYAGTGTPLTLGMLIKINVLTSKGAAGSTNTLIEPAEDEDFEAKYYIEESATPSVLHIEGSDVEDTESIRNTAVLFGNTANRAVTKKDYKTICEAQHYIDKAEIWGGEDEVPKDNPGHIIFSFIPSSRPINFIQDSNGNYILSDITQDELFYPTYYEITGKDRFWDVADTKNKNVLFNVLENYKIITLKLDYLKTIYVDFDIVIKVFKYKFGETITETNAKIFRKAKTFFVKNIEQYNSKYFYSSLLRYVDEEIGDEFGLEMTSEISVKLSDSMYQPEKGNFINSSLKDLNGSDNPKGLIGDNDLWKFSMPMGLPEIELFGSTEVLNGIIIKKGRLMEYKLTTCNTKDFLIPGDFLFMEMTPTSFISLDKDGKRDKYPNVYSETIEISIMYTKNYGSFKEGKSEVFKVGSCTIYKSKNVAMLEFFTHAYWNIESQAIVTEDLLKLEDKYKYYDNDLGTYIYQEEDLGKLRYYKVDEEGKLKYLENGKKIETTRVKNNPKSKYNNVPKPYTDDFPVFEFLDENDKKLYDYKNGVLPRYYFVEKPRKLMLNAYENNIKNIRNVFGRLRSISFI